jgi:hypothetical protein
VLHFAVYCATTATSPHLLTMHVAASCTAVYNVWAKYRTQITGREALDVILARHKAEQEGKTGSLCRDADGNVTAACDLPAGSSSNPQ